MFALLLAALTATPVPSPSPSDAPLKTIITVRSSPFCSQLATHLNAAIGAAVGNDQTLGRTILTLRSPDLADNELVRSHEVHRLQDMGDSIYKNYKAGLNEVDRLRELAKNAKDDAEKKELTAAADALGGVLYRQHLIQRDLDGFVAYLYAADMQADTNRDTLEREFNGDAAADYPYGEAQRNEPYLNLIQSMGRADVHPYLYRTPDTDVRMASNASQDFQNRLPDILHDEMMAGEHITQASDGC